MQLEAGILKKLLTSSSNSPAAKETLFRLRFLPLLPEESNSEAIMLPRDVVGLRSDGGS